VGDFLCAFECGGRTEPRALRGYPCLSRARQLRCYGVPGLGGRTRGPGAVWRAAPAAALLDVLGSSTSRLWAEAAWLFPDPALWFVEELVSGLPAMTPPPEVLQSELY
jgi:hypothetical protein